MIKTMLKYIIAELCLDILFTNIERNMAMPKRHNPFATLFGGEVILVNVSGGHVLAGEYITSDEETWTIELFDEGYCTFSDHVFPLSCVLTVDVLDEDDTEETDWIYEEVGNDLE